MLQSLHGHWESRFTKTQRKVVQLRYAPASLHKTPVFKSARAEHHQPCFDVEFPFDSVIVPDTKTPLTLVYSLMLNNRYLFSGFTTDTLQRFKLSNVFCL